MRITVGIGTPSSRSKMAALSTYLRIGKILNLLVEPEQEPYASSCESALSCSPMLFGSGLEHAGNSKTGVKASQQVQTRYRRTCNARSCNRPALESFASRVFAGPVRESRPVRDWDKRTRDICEGFQLG